MKGGTARILIVGGGCSGTLTAIQLLRTAPGPLEVVLIDRKPAWGEGVAYGTRWPGHLLNVAAGRMSALPDDPGHFVRWLLAQPSMRGLSPASAELRECFVPRTLYASYLRGLLEASADSAPPGVRLTRRTGCVTTLREKGERVELGLQSTDQSGHPVGAEAVIVGDSAVLAWGHLPPRPPALGSGAYPSTPCWVSDPWAPGVLDQVPIHGPLLLIGSGLTMVDVVLRLRERGCSGPFHVLSRHGLLPSSHRGGSRGSASLFVPDSGSLRALTRSVRRRISEGTARGEDWREVLDSLRSRTPGLWQGLSIPERRRFLRHLRSYWEWARHRVAPQIGSALETLVRDGHLIAHSGRLSELHQAPHDLRAVWRERSGRAETLRVNAVILCSGPEEDMRKAGEPLIAQLLDEGVIQPHPAGPGLATSTGGALVGATGRPSDRIFTLGPLRRGDLWETTAVPEIRVQAAALATTLLDSLAQGRIGKERTPEVFTWTHLRAVADAAVLSLRGGALRGLAFEIRPGGYGRAILHRDAGVEVAVLRWPTGSRTPLHGHGRSRAYLRVCSGALVEDAFLPDGEDFDFRQRVLEAESEGRLPAGAFHRVRAFRESYSVHVYDPPPEDAAAAVPETLRPVLRRARRRGRIRDAHGLPEPLTQRGPSTGPRDTHDRAVLAPPYDARFERMPTDSKRSCAT
jgi:uncharacterized NAD(P)/FAD-binding protein YdhS